MNAVDDDARTTGSPAPGATGLVLEVAPGFLFHAAVFCGLGFWFFPVGAYLAGGNSAEAILALCVLPICFAFSAIPLRRRWFLVADAQGLRVIRADRIVKHIAWDRITLVRHGETVITFGGPGLHYQKPADFLDVRALNPRARIWLGTDFFRFDHRTFVAIYARVIEEAGRRHVKVVRAKTGSWV